LPRQSSQTCSNQQCSDSQAAAVVEAAVKAIKTGSITYKAFCERVTAAGCVGYLVWMVGRRVVYYGRTCDNHVEWFPKAR
jgi:uncharacterized protein YbcV (DUF1398 family)